MNEIIKAENICRLFKSGRETVHAIKELSLTLQKGKFTVIRGNSGAGKTTLMNLLTTIDDPTSGKIFFEKSDTSVLAGSQKDTLRRKNMGLVFQSVALIPVMSAYENVELALRMSGKSLNGAEKRVQECLEYVGLGKRMGHRAHELSGGEQQRVAIARAIVHRPKIVFADEPTSELDTKMGDHIIRMFKNLVHNEDYTIVMTTHDRSVMEAADIVYSLKDGELINE